MIRKIFEDPRLPTERPFKEAVAIYAKRFAIFIAVVIANLLFGVLLLLLKESLFWGLIAFLCVCLILAKLINERISRMVNKVMIFLFSFLGALWLFIKIGQFIKSQFSWGEDTLFWVLWICLMLVLVLGVYAIDMRYENIET